MIEDIELKEQADIKINDDMETVSFETATDIFNYEKDSPTIQKEIKEFEGLSSDKKEALKDAVDSKGFGFADLDDTENGFDDIIEEKQAQDIEEESQFQEQVVEQPIEEFFQSAEFVIMVLDFIIIYGTNIYLKQNQLDKVGKEELRREKIEQKVLRDALAEVLKKYNYKMSPEVNLCIVLISGYGVKVKAIVDRQKMRKSLEIAEARVSGKKPVPQEVKMATVKDKVKEEVIEKKEAVKQSSFKLDTDKVITQDKDIDLTDEKVRANMNIPPVDKTVKKLGIKT